MSPGNGAHAEVALLLEDAHPRVLLVLAQHGLPVVDRRWATRRVRDTELIDLQGDDGVGVSMSERGVDDAEVDLGGPSAAIAAPFDDTPTAPAGGRFSAAQGGRDDGARLLLHLGQMVGAAEGLRVDLVDVLGA